MCPSMFDESTSQVKQNLITSKMEITNMSAQKQRIKQTTHFKLKHHHFRNWRCDVELPVERKQIETSSQQRVNAYALIWQSADLKVIVKWMTHIIQNMMKILNQQISIHRSKVLPRHNNFMSKWQDASSLTHNLAQTCFSLTWSSVLAQLANAPTG